MTTGPIPDPPRTARVLHLALLGGLLVIVAMFLFLVFGVLGAPLLTSADETSFIGYVLAAFGLLALVLAVLVLRPRVPTRSSGQSDAEYWQDAFQPALLVWTALEGGGITCAVGALLTGHWAPMAVVVAAVGCFVALRPSHFDNS
jgi:hypothetical protein